MLLCLYFLYTLFASFTIMSFLPLDKTGYRGCEVQRKWV